MQRSGFSLVELSIVLVILGLLTGAIVAGKAVINASELRVVIREYTTYSTAAQNFATKFDALPGDFMNATQYWGDNSSQCSDAAIADGNPGTCNGNGNDAIEAGTASNTGEMFQFWTQLSGAKMIAGRFTGVSGSGSGSHTNFSGNTPNVPDSRVANAGWSVAYRIVDSMTMPNWYYVDNGLYGNTLQFGAQITNDSTYGPGLVPADAMKIDGKIDDGRPAFGRILGYPLNDTCASADSGSSTNVNLNASYLVSATTAQCALIFRQAF